MRCILDRRIGRLVRIDSSRRNRIEIIWILAIIGGLITTIEGNGGSTVVCHCPAQIDGQLNSCQRGEAPEQTFGSQLVYLGIPITIGGVFVAGIRFLKT